MIGATTASTRARTMMSAIAPPPPRSRVAARPPAAAPEREAQEPVGEQRDRADQDPDEQREPDVEVADVAHLVADDALQLLPVELLEQAGRDRHAGVLRIAAGGERVRRRVGDDLDPWARQAAGEAHLLDDVEELLVRLGRLRPIHLAGTARRHARARRPRSTSRRSSRWRRRAPRPRRPSRSRSRTRSPRP